MFYENGNAADLERHGPAACGGVCGLGAGGRVEEGAADPAGGADGARGPDAGLQTHDLQVVSGSHRVGVDGVECGDASAVRPDGAGLGRTEAAGPHLPHRLEKPTKTRKLSRRTLIQSIKSITTVPTRTK